MYEPIPTDEIPVARTGKYFGVKLPRSVPFFDCRWPNDKELPTVDGITLWSSERASLALGLRRHTTYPCSIQFYFDSRHPEMPHETARVIRSSRVQLARQWKAYRRGLRNPAKPGEGGSIAYKPAFVALCNYGISVGADERSAVTASFYPYNIGCISKVSENLEKEPTQP
jgi:hypothetical protein